jgi:hypothetical protein
MGGVDILVPARTQKLKSSWDRDAAIHKVNAETSRTRSNTQFDRLYEDSHRPTPRTARAEKKRTEFLQSQLKYTSKLDDQRPEGFVKDKNGDMVRTQSAAARSTLTERRKFAYKDELTARGNDMFANEANSKKKADFGSGHPMWSPYYRPSGPGVTSINYFTQASKDVGSFKTDPTLSELAPAMLISNARLAANIKAELKFNPYPQHLNMSPRDKEGKVVPIKRKDIKDSELKDLMGVFFTSEKKAEDKEFGEKFSKKLYEQWHKKIATLADVGDDPFKLSKEDMFKKNNDLKYVSKHVAPCFDMGAKMNWNYNEFHCDTGPASSI